MAAGARVSGVREEAERAGLTLETVDGPALATLADGGEARGVVALADPPREVDLDDLLDALMRPAPADAPRMLVALDGVEDPQNLGAIIRTAEFFGAQGVVWTRDRAASVTASVVRASAGATERLPLCRVVNLARALDACKQRGAWVLGTVVDGGTPLVDVLSRLGAPRVVVLGSEHRGLRRLTRDRCDVLATVPGRGGVGSLNVAAAAAIVLAGVGSAPDD